MVLDKPRKRFWNEEYERKRAAVTAMDPAIGAAMPYNTACELSYSMLSATAHPVHPQDAFLLPRLLQAIHRAFKVGHTRNSWGQDLGLQPHLCKVKGVLEYLGDHPSKLFCFSSSDTAQMKRQPTPPMTISFPASLNASLSTGSSSLID